MRRSATDSPLSDKYEAVLSKYNLTKFGFLPENCIQRLSPEFDVWENIMDKLPHLNRTRRLHSVIEDMPILNASKLGEEGMLRRAFIVVGMLVHSYINGPDVPWESPHDGNINSLQENPRSAGQENFLAGKCFSEIGTTSSRNKFFSPETSKLENKMQELPPQLSVPWYFICSKLGLPHVLTATLDLWNWKLKNDKLPIDILNLTCISTMTGTSAEIYFHMIPCAMQASAGPIIPKVFLVDELITQSNTKEIIALLKQTANVFGHFREIFEKVSNLVDPKIFYFIYRPLLAGYWPNGIVLNGIDQCGNICSCLESESSSTSDSPETNDTGSSVNDYYLTDRISNITEISHVCRGINNDYYNGSQMARCNGSIRQELADLHSTNACVIRPKSKDDKDYNKVNQYGMSDEVDMVDSKNGIDTSDIIGLGTRSRLETKMTEKNDAQNLSNKCHYVAKAKGPSAGQSTMILLFDLMLGIQHEGEGSEFQGEMLDYMPCEHRQMAIDFKERISRSGSVRNYVSFRISSKNVEDIELKNAYNDCINSVSAFRSFHLNTVSSYLERTKKGTGESSFKFMLKSMIQTTKRSKFD